MGNLHDTVLGLSLGVFFFGTIFGFVAFMMMNHPSTWRGDPFKWLFVWGYREKYLREHGDKVN